MTSVARMARFRTRELGRSIETANVTDFLAKRSTSRPVHPVASGSVPHFFRTDAEAPRPYPASAGERRRWLKETAR